MKNLISFLSISIVYLLSNFALAQSESERERIPLVVDEIQFDLKAVSLAKDTLKIDLFAISYEKNPRDFRLNVFGIQIIDSQDSAHMVTSVQMDRVLVPLSKRQNYLNYLLKQDVPVPIYLRISPLTEELKNVKLVRLIFESLEEDGKFIPVEIPLK
ncbi:hypothetical protein ACFRAE_12420 [Sphingobacterium sp. HJSM2_6]|uniref:hypothetical protein n=1 Tax=Sphingobacterium sp. HJSM2_6 TaxID=3366264 RepID=UPI003BE20F1B